MLLITEHYHAMGLLARPQTLPSTDYPTYKIYCMIFVSPLCQSCNHLMFRDWSVSVLRDGAWPIGGAPDALPIMFETS